jgi:hypothetical protein
MTGPIAPMIHERIHKTHQRLLESAAELPEEQLAWRPGDHAPSIAFHLWHMARWADRLQATLPPAAASPMQHDPAREIWAAAALARAWGWRDDALGYGQTGMELSDEMAADLRLPPGDVLLDYARQAFAAADSAVGALADGQLTERGDDIYGQASSVGYVLLVHLSHASRHLGMIECLRGVLGLRGTATV